MKTRPTAVVSRRSASSLKESYSGEFVVLGSTYCNNLYLYHFKYERRSQNFSTAYWGTLCRTSCLVLRLGTDVALNLYTLTL